jgi:hypothetical protein
MKRNLLSDIAAALTLTFSLCGCVAIDSRASQEPLDKNATQNISGHFQNYSSYHSEKMGFVGSAKFSDLLEIYGEQNKADSFVITYSENEGLTVQFKEDGRNIFTKKLSPADGLKLNSEGKFEFHTPGGCSGDESGLFGCSSKTVTLFLNPDGDLVTVDSGGGAGMLGILPIGIYGKLVAIFPRMH